MPDALVESRVDYARAKLSRSIDQAWLDRIIAEADRIARLGRTPVLFAVDGAPVGVIGIADVLKPTSVAAVSAFRALGLDTWMLTGDTAATAIAIAAEAGIDLELFNKYGITLTQANNSIQQQIMPVPVPAIGGFSSVWSNVGKR